MKLFVSTFTLLLIFLFSACSSDKELLIKDNNLTAISGQEVTVQASGALSYSWKQTSGIDVVLVGANTATLKFIAPEVVQEEKLTFELTAVITQAVGNVNAVIKKEKATVTITPLKQEDTNSSDDTNTTTETNTTQSTVSLTSLKLTLEKTSLNIETNTTLSVIATYDDNSSKDVTDEVEWILSDTNAVQITNKTLHTKKDINVFIQAKLSNKTSNTQALEIYKEINGHRLPPEPDPTINNSTLLGIDVNNNGVRDDVERWIYEEYKDKHPIHIDIAMQAGRAYKQVLETPERALEIHDEVGAPLECDAYYSIYAKYFNESVLLKEDVVSRYFRNKIYFNTKKRMDAYDQYDSLLSGGAYDLPKMEELKAKCDFNTSKYE